MQPEGSVRARLLSVRLADDLDRLIRETRRDVGPFSLNGPRRCHSVSMSRVTTSSHGWSRSTGCGRRCRSRWRLGIPTLRIGGAYEPRSWVSVSAGMRRCSAVSSVSARVFLDEQNRQAFRPPPLGYLPDLPSEVLHPLLMAGSDDALAMTLRWITDVSGPVAPRLPRLHRVTTELLTVRDVEEADTEPDDEEALDPPELPLIALAVAAAARAVQTVDLPARLSTVIVECLNQGAAEDGTDPFTVAEVVALAALWCYAPEDAEPHDAARQDLASAVLGVRAAVDSDGRQLELPRWTGDNLILEPFADVLETADPAGDTRCACPSAALCGTCQPSGSGGAGWPTADEQVDIGTLIGFAVQPTVRAGNKPEFPVLGRYRSEVEFKDAADAVLHGLQAEVLSDSNHGLILGVLPDSPFAFRYSDLPFTSKREYRLVAGLVLTAGPHSRSPSPAGLDAERVRHVNASSSSNGYAKRVERAAPRRVG